jgi:hypothetical protein
MGLGSWIRDSRSGIRDPGSEIRDPEKPIPDPGVKKGPDLGSATVFKLPEAVRICWVPQTA